MRPFNYTRFSPRLKVTNKKKFNIWIENSSLSKAILFLSFQTIQKRHIGVALQTLLLFLPTNEPCHPKRTSLTNEGIIHNTLKKLNNKSHKTLDLEQWVRKWSMVSSTSQQRKHLFRSDHSLFFSWSKVKTLPQEASQAKNPTLGGT